MAKIKVESKYLRARFGHGLDYGYSSIPNLIIDHAEKLGLKDFEVFFIVKIIRLQYKSKTGMIKDADLEVSSSLKTLQRFRKKLQLLKDDNGKPLVFVKSYYTQNEEGKYIGHGTEYDFRAFYDYLINTYEEPKGLPDSSDSGNDDKPKRLSVSLDDEIEMGNGIPGHDKANDGLKDRYCIKKSKKKEKRITAELLFSYEGWEFYSDETAKYKDDDKYIEWNRVWVMLDEETMAKMDKYRLTGYIS